MIVKFLNTTIIQWVAYLFIKADGTNKQRMEVIFEEAGLVLNISTQFLSNLIIPPLVEIIDLDGKIQRI